MDAPPRTQQPDAASAVERGPSAPAAQAAAAALLALSRTARSFVLYDASNAVVRQLLAEYQAKMRDALDRHGEIAIELRPFDMLVGGEVVYHDADREKSLAFRLFRDGVRRLVFATRVTWDELLTLLEILAVRYTGVRQQEEDTVTLLRKAELHGIAIEAVEGFTPAEETPEPELEATAASARRYQPPAGWDTPLQKLPPPGPLAYREVSEDALADVRALGEDEGQDGVAELALSVARDLLAEAVRSGWPTPNKDLAAFFAELRDGLLADGQLASLRRLVDLLGEAGGGELRDGMLRGLGDARTPDLVPFLPLLGIGAALDQLAPGATEVGEGRRRLLTKLVLARLPREADAVLARLPVLDIRLARDLARTIVARAPERSNEVARQLLAQRDEALRLEGLAALEGAPGEVPLRPLCDLLHDASEAVRVRAVEVLGRRGDESVLDLLRGAIEDG